MNRQETVARRPAQPGYRDPPTDLTPEQQAHNRRVLLAAVGDEPVVVAFDEREAV